MEVICGRREHVLLLRSTTLYERSENDVNLLLVFSLLQINLSPVWNFFFYQLLCIWFPYAEHALTEDDVISASSAVIWMHNVNCKRGGETRTQVWRRL